MGDEKEVRTPPRGFEEMASEVVRELFQPPARVGQEQPQVPPRNGRNMEVDVNLRLFPHRESPDDHMKRAIGDFYEQKARGEKQKNDLFSARLCAGFMAVVGILAYVLAH